MTVTISLHDKLDFWDKDCKLETGSIVCCAVYILEELWSILQSSGPETSEGFVEFVNRRLQHKSPVVKHKVGSHS